MAGEQNRPEENFKYRESFRQNAFNLIVDMVCLSDETEEDTTHLVDEILHSIFFLGRIYNPQFSPESIVTDAEMLEYLKDSYPQAFRLYSSRLPRRAPFSCVLDMIVHKAGQENESEIKNQLKQLVMELGGATTKNMLSTTMCVSQIVGSNSNRYYGVSLSTFGKVAGRIMVAVSCLGTWHEHVAGAVLSYDLLKSPRQFFNGTIRLPENVRCEAYNISDQNPKPPCRSCGNLFGFDTNERNRWPYGNCAEVESVSELLKNEADVTEQVQFQSEWTTEERQRAERALREELNPLLRMSKYKWDGEFFVPQGAQLLEENDIDIN